MLLSRIVGGCPTFRTRQVLHRNLLLASFGLSLSQQMKRHYSGGIKVYGTEKVFSRPVTRLSILIISEGDVLYFNAL